MITLTVGSTLQSGKYEIIKILGQGGFGITYLAKHRLLGTLFAIKEFFPQDYCNREGDTSHITVATQSNVDLVEKLRARFITEAQNIASLKHPGIIQIHDVFEENNTAYYVMDFIGGKSLDDLIAAKGPLQERAAINYMVKVAGALDFIHKRNMTHFDVKPANIMVRSLDGEPVLIDFGLSKQFNEQGHARSTLLMGVSHGFSALEQYFQDGITGFSPQTDVYSLGATLYFLLTQRVPPEAPRLSGTLIEVPETVSPNVAETIRWAMITDPKKRCPSAEQFIKSLRNAEASSSRTVALASLQDSYVPASGPKTTIGGQNLSLNQANNVASTTDYSNNPESQKKNNKWIIVAAIILGFIIAGGLIGWFVSSSNSSSRSSRRNISQTESSGNRSYNDDDGSDNSKNELMEEEVEVVEAAPAEASDYSADMFSNSSSQFGKFNLTGNVKGYPIVMEITCTEGSNGTCNVSGRYAYNSTLKKYGRGESSWFYFSGSGNVDGSDIECEDRTSANPDYRGHLSISFKNGVLSGTVYSNVDNAEVCSIYAD